MKKRKNIKYLVGAATLATELFLSSCGLTSIEDRSTETIMQNDDFNQDMLDASINGVVNGSKSIVENDALFSMRRKMFELFGADSTVFFTDEYRNIETMNLTWNSLKKSYEIALIRDETIVCRLSISSEDYDIIDFLLHQTNCQNLVVSYASDNKLLSLFAECDKLKSLCIYDANISSLSGIENLTNLEELYIKNCENITDLTPTENLTKLTKVTIIGTKIADISAFANLSKLIYLDLSCNEITNPEVLNDLENIEYLCLAYNKIVDVEQLRTFIEKGIIPEKIANLWADYIREQDCSYVFDNFEASHSLYVTYLDSKEAYLVEMVDNLVEMVDNNATLTGMALLSSPEDIYILTRDVPNCTNIVLCNFPKSFSNLRIYGKENYEYIGLQHCDFDDLNWLDDFSGLTCLAIYNCPNLIDLPSINGVTVYLNGELLTPPRVENNQEEERSLGLTPEN